MDDSDRLEWLQKISDTLRRQSVSGKGAVIGCSALKIKYRRILRGLCLSYDPNSVPPAENHTSNHIVNFLYLKGNFDTLRNRLEERSLHFMPASLLQSQFEALEEPTESEFTDAGLGVCGKLITVSIDMDPLEIVNTTISSLFTKPKN